MTHDPPLNSTAALRSRPLRACCGVLDSRIALPSVCPTCRCPGADAVRAREEYWRGREGAPLGLPRPVRRVQLQQAALFALPVGVILVAPFVRPLSSMVVLATAFAGYFVTKAVVRAITFRRMSAVIARAEASNWLACTNCAHPLALSGGDPVTCPECGHVALRADVEQAWKGSQRLRDFHRPFGVLRHLRRHGVR